MSFRSVGNKSLIHLFTWLSFRTYTRNPSLRSWVEILPPCGRQNDSFRGRLPYVIPSEIGSHLSFRTETYGRVWGISPFLLETVAIILSLSGRCFAIAQHDIRLGRDSSVLRISEWQANVIPNVCEEIPGYYWWEILRGSAPQNDIIQQRAITTNERFFLSTVVRMTVRLGWDSSLRLRSVQNDNRVIPSAREESLVTTTWGKILHFTAFHSERHCTVRATSLNRRCFATLSMTSKCHSMRGR